MARALRCEDARRAVLSFSAVGGNAHIGRLSLLCGEGASQTSLRQASGEDGDAFCASTALRAFLLFSLLALPTQVTFRALACAAYSITTSKALWISYTKHSQ